MIGQADAIAAMTPIAAGLASNRGRRISQGRRRGVRRTFRTRSRYISASPRWLQIDAALQSAMDDGSWKQAIDKM